ncbi:ABC transporter permease [Hathewaya limosa]|uniref:Spermidine/putrescine transport system permease protein n=1 Tax=Hathewaya limosa TaxID=1536 RepID=A0ABU0JRL9_HATLI|nr:ABC transporter permease [Hathewaya limosa]AWZ48579.1 ABC transporter permease [Clostridiaceae bacterium 14S0207]MDQ0478823.1 spermidine/putrescine transport system permease protein [Hathewaya limosa]
MKKYTSYPYILWNIIFIVCPLLLIVYFSVTKSVIDPSVTLEHYKRFMDPLYINILFRSIKLAAFCTILCLILGYPLAYILSGLEHRKRNILVMLLVLPMWMNFLLRTYAWMAILGKHGFINSFLTWLSLPPLKLLYNDGAVLLGMVYNFLPFMVLPIYTILNKMDDSLIEAASDLGATKLQIFYKVIFPLSMPGVFSGITMVFMPAVTTFVISRLLGGGQYMLIGNLIEQQYLTVGDWNFGSAVSIIMIIIILITMAFMSKVDKEEGGGGLW